MCLTFTEISTAGVRQDVGQSLTPWLLPQLPLCICAKIFDASAEAVQVLVQRPERFLKSPVHAAYLAIDVPPHLHTMTGCVMCHVSCMLYSKIPGKSHLLWQTCDEIGAPKEC